MPRGKKNRSVVLSCYCFRARGIVSAVCSIVLSKASKPFIIMIMIMILSDSDSDSDTLFSYCVRRTRPNTVLIRDS